MKERVYFNVELGRGVSDGMVSENTMPDNHSGVH